MAAAEHGGYVVVQRGDEAELPDRLADRVWLAARVLGTRTATMQTASQTASQPKTSWDDAEEVRTLLRCARAWACWAHLGCEYAPECMQRVRRAHASARAPRSGA